MKGELAMYRDLSQWAMVRRRVLDEGVSRRQIVRETGINRGTIRKMLLHRCPQPFSPRTPRHPKLGPYTKTIDRLAGTNLRSPPEFRLSVTEIFRHLQREKEYAGSYGAVKDYVTRNFGPSRRLDIEVWNDTYELIGSLEKSDAIDFMRTISCAKAPIFSPLRARKFFGEAANLMKSRSHVSPQKARIKRGIEWINGVLRREVSLTELREEFGRLPEFPDIVQHLYESRRTYRNRAMVVLAHLHGISDHTVASALKINRHTVHCAREIFRKDGLAGLFAPKSRSNQKVDDNELKSAIFSILHEPPSNHGINRTSWIMADLRGVLAKVGKPACPEVVRAITKAAGYKWRTARVVLTSNDPDYAEKLARIRSTLSALKPDEAFFSIDEFGPFAVKTKSGRTLTAPGEQREVQQWQKSKGCLILTAALELSSNQVTHFYSLKKNTAEMIRMMALLLEQYKDKRKLYLSWDAASWHISKKLFERIEANNQMVFVTNAGPMVETVPLPARAQFLNVIESIFSGMARAIIHNSDYQSVDDAKAAIDGHFGERNRHFLANPHRAGNKIWGKERVPAEFSAGNNCKDPRYR
jgi:transposase